MKTDSCRTSSDRSLNQGQAQIEYVTVSLVTVLNTVTRDLLVKFRAPHRFFFIASVSNTYAASLLAIHFAPLGLNPNNGGNVIQPTGAEAWIPLSNPNNSTGRPEGRWFRCAEGVGVSQFFLDADHPAGSGGNFFVTFGGTDDLDELIAERTQVNRCTTGAQRSISGPNRVPLIEYQTFQAVMPAGPTPPYVLRDFFCGFKRPHKFFFFAAIDASVAGSDFFVHLYPLNLNPANPFLNIVPTGNEQWIPIYNGLNIAAPYNVEGRWFRFGKPVQGFYVDTDHPNGPSTITFTIGGTDDIEAFAGERL